MATIRIIKVAGNFFIQSKTGISDTMLSWKAKGILSYLLSKPDNWKPQVSDLVNQSPGGKDQVYATINELIQHGYMRRLVSRSEQGRIITTSYEVYEEPQLASKNNFQSLLPESPEVAHCLPFRENKEIDDETEISSDRPFPENPDSENADINNNDINKNKAAAMQVGKVNIPPIAAAALNNQSLAAEKHFSSENKTASLLSTQETLIQSNLTPAQLHKVDEELKRLHQDMPLEHPAQLKQEIIYSLLDPTCFSKIGNNFPRKLKAISNSIRDQTWNPPLSMVKSIQKQRQAEINALKTELYKAQAQVNYCNDMIAYVKLYPDFNCTHAKAEKPKYEAQVHHLKAKLSAFIEKEYQKRELHYQAS